MRASAKSPVASPEGQAGRAAAAPESVANLQLCHAARERGLRRLSSRACFYRVLSSRACGGYSAYQEFGGIRGSVQSAPMCWAR